MRRSIITTLVMVAISSPAMAKGIESQGIEPRSLTWHIVSDAEMSRICRSHGQRANCEGLAAWDKEFRMCIIWTRSPRSANDLARWQVVHHELMHCQAGHHH